MWLDVMQRWQTATRHFVASYEFGDCWRQLRQVLQTKTGAERLQRHLWRWHNWRPKYEFFVQHWN